MKLPLSLATPLFVLGAVAPQSSPGAPSAPSGQPLDAAYTSEIKKHTTNECFSTPWVDHLPASDEVPTTVDVLGHIAGAPDVLSYSHEVHRYMRAVAEASPRVAVLPGGRSEEGREMILVVVGSEESIQNLDRYKAITNKLADPRQISEAEARRLIRDGKPIYWATGAMHSPETGSPEMLMELVYRLAVEETPFIRAIRDNLIFMTTPVLDVDGRDKRVDLLKLRQAKKPVPRLLYWGKYVAHDNNRDAIAMGLALSRHLMGTFLEFKPTVLHDLHESANHLYTSTGTGPYNAWIDPILVDEWHVLAYQEITELTKRGVPGVWTHDFYDGWHCNYGFYAANGHNAIGRFYETQGAGDANTRRIRSRATRAWYRPNPPLPSTMFSIRNNVNLQQSGLLIAMNYMANHKDKFLENFWLKSKRSCRKPQNEGPAAYLFSSTEPRRRQQADLLNLLIRQGCEVHRLVHDAKLGEQEIPARSYVVRMDQPYSRMADMLLDRCYYNVSDPRPYDDTGWTLGPLFNVRTERIEDVAVLDLLMDKVEGEVRVEGGTRRLTDGKAVVYLIDYTADNAVATFRFANMDMDMQAAEKAFELGGRKFRAGTLIIPVEGNCKDVAQRLAESGRELGLTAFGANRFPDVAAHPVSVPGIAVMHTWTSTQNEGWLRMAFDKCRIPHDYISVHEVRDDPKLRDKYDVIVFGPSSSDALSIVRGLPKTGQPLPWKKSDVSPNLGRQASTEDMRGGLELEGVMHLRDFVQDGGTLVCIQNSCSLPIHFGLAPGVSIAETEKLNCRGSVLRAEVADPRSPIAYGFDPEVGVLFRQAPVLETGRRPSRRVREFLRRRGIGSEGSAPEERLLAGEARPTGRGTVDDPDRPQGRPPDLGRQRDEPGERAARPGRAARRGRSGRFSGGRSRARTVLRFARDHKKLLLSGMLAGGDELAGKPAVVDVPLGAGHVVLFAIQPTWRHITQGSYPLVYNAILHWDHLGPAPRSSELATNER